MELETASPEGLAQSEALPEDNEDAQYAEVYRKASAEGIKDDAPEAEEPAVVEQVVKQPEPPPSELPASVRQHWDTIPTEAREAIVGAQRDLSRKLAEQGRLVQGVAPIRDALVSAAKDIPHLMNMRPEQVASEVMELAKISQAFNEKPVETLVSLAKRHGIEDKLRAAFTGQQQPQDAKLIASLQNELRELKGHLSRVADPEYLREQIATVTTQGRVMDDVTAFANGAEHWGKVENYIPTLIPAVKAKLGEGASAQDVLSQAYELALQLYLPEAKAQASAAVKAADAPDPEKAAQAQKAKSVNVKGAVTGKDRELSEDERLAMIYRRASQK